MVKRYECPICGQGIYEAWQLEDGRVVCDGCADCGRLAEQGPVTLTDFLWQPTAFWGGEACHITCTPPIKFSLSVVGGAGRYWVQATEVIVPGNGTIVGVRPTEGMGGGDWESMDEIRSELEEQVGRIYWAYAREQLTGDDLHAVDREIWETCKQRLQVELRVPDATKA